MDVSWQVELLCRAIAVAVMCICTVLKVPQIYNIYKLGSTKGISLKSLLMEYWCFTILLSYPCANGYPLSGYGEFLLLVAQDTIMLLMLLKDRSLLTIGTGSALVLYLAHIYGLAMNMYPPWVLYTLMTTVTPLSAMGKILQIYSIVSTKSAGSVSALTWALATTTALARVFTLSVETGDMALIYISFQAGVLNGIIFLSASIYKNKSKVKTS